MSGDTSFGASAAGEAAAAIRQRIGVSPRVALILGSGLGGLTASVERAVSVPYRDIPGFPAATIKGHAGELVAGMLAGKPVAAMSGRFHMYEGHSARLAGFPARVLHALGATTLIVSNAAGTVSRQVKPETIMLIEDHINLMFRNPLVGPAEDGDTRFPDMSEPYDRELRALARRVATRQKTEVTEGVYAAVLGPSYETRAEVAMLGRLGAHAVGMSTVPEVIVARALGVRVLGFSCVSNWASGLSTDPVTHEEVLAATARLASRLQNLVREVVAELPA